MAVLGNVKVLLNINDNLEDDKLNIIINNTTARLKSFLDPITYPKVPTELDYIIEEVTVKRYNRIGAEGMSQESVDGRSSTYQLNDFDEYLSVLSNYNPLETTRGKVTFY